MSLPNFYIPGKIWTPCLLQEMQRGPKILGKKKKILWERMNTNIFISYQKA